MKASDFPTVKQFALEQMEREGVGRSAIAMRFKRGAYRKQFRLHVEHARLIYVIPRGVKLS